MCKKILMVATVDQHIRHFHLPLIKKLSENGTEIHVAARGEEKFAKVSKKYSIPFERSPFKFNNIKSFFLLKKIIKKENYDVIHVNTPVGATIGRLAAISFLRKSPKIIYTAHGFHFFQGAPLSFWLIFFPIEYLLAKITDVILTMNREDTLIAKKFFGKEKIIQINGVGVDKKKFHKTTKQEYLSARKRLSIKDNDIVLLYVAEISERKNQRLIIDIMSDAVNNIPNLKLFLLGEGLLFPEIRELITEKHLNNEIIMTGYTTSVSEYLKAADIYISTSLQEGLPINIIEAMFTNIPCLVTGCRGNVDLIEGYSNGKIIALDQHVKENFVQSLNEFVNKLEITNKFIETSNDEINKYDLEQVTNVLWKIYKNKLF
ncbi:glycosyltransferase [Enterococcus gallinarum]|uniref:glycosyltransferase n=1 Tax=Enterococcus gallinarum TaxID=1353 RepID=UPI001E3AEBDD|nr:glycosyltransferase [Enterococcus gallinarum]MCD4997446.1 glycosyltransferase [Enterococcus gallinarum]MDT2728822.1 glycosyltransferase [Enterococcus gallinarum]